MKLQIDTTNKKITIEESVNLKDLFSLLKKLLPNNEWKEFELKVAVINNWNNPIIIREPYYVPRNPYPWWGGTPAIPLMTTSGTQTDDINEYKPYKTKDISLTAGTFCIEAKM